MKQWASDLVQSLRDDRQWRAAWAFAAFGTLIAGVFFLIMEGTVSIFISSIPLLLLWLAAVTS